MFAGPLYLIVHHHHIFFLLVIIFHLLHSTHVFITFLLLLPLKNSKNLKNTTTTRSIATRKSQQQEAELWCKITFLKAKSAAKMTWSTSSRSWYVMQNYFDFFWNSNIIGNSSDLFLISVKNTYPTTTDSKRPCPTFCVSLFG